MTRFATRTGHKGGAKVIGLLCYAVSGAMQAFTARKMEFVRGLGRTVGLRWSAVLGGVG